MLLLVQAWLVLSAGLLAVLVVLIGLQSLLRLVRRRSLTAVPQPVAAGLPRTAGVAAVSIPAMRMPVTMPASLAAPAWQHHARELERHTADVR